MKKNLIFSFLYLMTLIACQQPSQTSIEKQDKSVVNETKETFPVGKQSPLVAPSDDDSKNTGNTTTNKPDNTIDKDENKTLSPVTEGKQSVVNNQQQKSNESVGSASVPETTVYISLNNTEPKDESLGNVSITLNPEKVEKE